MPGRRYEGYDHPFFLRPLRVQWEITGKKSEHLGSLAAHVLLVGFVQLCNCSEPTGGGCPLIKLRLLAITTQDLSNGQSVLQVNLTAFWVWLTFSIQVRGFIYAPPPALFLPCIVSASLAQSCVMWETDTIDLRFSCPSRLQHSKNHGNDRGRFMFVWVQCSPI